MWELVFWGFWCLSILCLTLYARCSKQGTLAQGVLQEAQGTKGHGARVSVQGGMAQGDWCKISHCKGLSARGHGASRLVQVAQPMAQGARLSNNTYQIRPHLVASPKLLYPLLLKNARNLK